MSDNLYVQLYLQLLSKLSGRNEQEVIEWARSKLAPDVRGVISGATSLFSRGGDVRGVLSGATSLFSGGGGKISRLIGDFDFQYTYPLHDWWWPAPPEGYIDPNAYLFLSRMPVTPPNQLVTKYDPSAKDLFSTYRSVLLSAPKVDVGTPASQPWVSEYKKALTDSEKPSSPSEDKPGFVKMTTNTGTISVGNFVVADGKDWQSELKEKAEEKNAKEDTYIPGGDRGVLGVLQKVSLNITAGSAPVKFLSFTIPSDPFFSVSITRNEWQHFDIPLDDKSVSVSIKVGAITRVPVQPDPRWYDSDYLQSLAKRDSWNPPFTTADVFGEKGLLSQRIDGLIAAYHVAFKITVSPDTYKKFQPIFDAAIAFRIGPFKFGLGASVSIPGADVVPKVADWKHQARAETSTFEGESMADYPVIIGVTVQKILLD